MFLPNHLNSSHKDTPFLTLLNNSIDGILITSEEELVLYANPAAERLLAQNGEDLVGKPLAFSIPKGASRQKIALAGPAQELYIEVSSTGTCWYEQPAYMSVLHDISSEEKVRRELFSAKRTIEEVAQGFPGQIFQFAVSRDQKFSFPFLGELDSTLTGLPGEVVKENPERVIDLNPPAVASELRRRILESAESLEFFSYEYPQRNIRGEVKWLNIRGIPYRQADGSTLFYGFALDVSEIKEKEEALQRLSLEVEAARRVKKNFLANMSHEIRTPMNAIIGTSYLLTDDNLSEEQVRYVRLIRESGNHLLSLINTIIDFAKIEIGQVENEKSSFDLKKLFKEVYELTSMQSTTGHIPVLWDIQDDVPTVLFGDALRLKQVLIHLIENGIKFTREGSVEVSCTVESREEKQVRLRFKISDTGVGIPEEKLDGLFEAFSQADASSTREYGGAGLGLALSKKLAELLGGDLKITSEVGKGTTCSLVLPFETAAYAVPANGGATEEESVCSESERISDSGPEYRVLLIEDNPFNRKIAQNLLARFGYRSLCTEPGLEVLKKIKKEAPDLVLIDLDPETEECDGESLVGKIRAGEAGAALSDLPVIGISSNHGVMERRGALAAGMCELLPKPLQPEQLRMALRTCVSQRTKKEAQLPISYTTGLNREIFDFEELYENCFQDTEYIRELLELFVTEMSERVERIARISRQNEPSLARKEAYALKGAAVTVKAHDLARIAEKIESALDESPRQDIQDLSGELERSFAVLKEVLQRKLFPQLWA